MHLDKYSPLSDATHSTYEFLSLGPKGTIKKVVKYTRIQPNVYNLGFGDWDEITQGVRDDTRTNNNDRDKVLATVASTVVDFIKYHPGATIFAEGSTPAKTRLYQMGIFGNWHEISQLFDVKGFREGEWEDFEPGKSYNAFVLMAK